MYGPETLHQVEVQSRAIAEQLSPSLPSSVTLVWKPVLTGATAIRRACLDANGDDGCIGVITWMHTFSPAKMWIQGLDELRKPLLHLHTQANESLPWSTIDMDFMNLNQAAHGDREFAHIQTRLGVARKTVAGHISDPTVIGRIVTWVRASIGARALRNLRIVRFGDNMRNVAVTEGDKVEAEHRFGVSVNTYGVNDLVAVVDGADESAVDEIVGRVSRVLRRRRRASARRRASRVAPRRRPHRGRAPSVPRRRRIRRVHDQLRGSRRAPSAARASPSSG